jgi:hypothetical protein
MNAAMANSIATKLSARRTQRHYSHDGTVGSKGSLGGQVGEENAWRPHWTARKRSSNFDFQSARGWTGTARREFQVVQIGQDQVLGSYCAGRCKMPKNNRDGSGAVKAQSEKRGSRHG